MKVECLILILVLMLNGFDGLEEVTDQNTWMKLFIELGFVDWREVGDNIKDTTCINTYMARRQKHQQRAIIALVFMYGFANLNCSKSIIPIDKVRIEAENRNDVDIKFETATALRCGCKLANNEEHDDNFNILTSLIKDCHYVMNRINDTMWEINEVWSFANPLQ